MDLLAGLGSILPEDRVVSERDDLERHGGGIFTYHAPVPPDVVVYPESREEVIRVIRFAGENRVPIVPFGEGSSLEAHPPCPRRHQPGPGAHEQHPRGQA